MSLSVTRLLLVFLVSLVFAAAAGCGDDDDNGGGGGGDEQSETAAPEEEAEEEPEDGEAVSEIDEETLREFIDAINEDPSILCDPANITAEALEAIGGEEECLAAAEGEEAGAPYEILDLSIEGDTAVATIEDEDSTDEVTFVLEEDEIKYAGQEDVE